MKLFFMSVMHLLIPPPNSSEEEITRWRFLSAAFTSVALVTSIVMVVIAFGLTPWHEGFATKMELKQIHMSRLERDLIDLRRNQCFAVMQDNNDAIVFLSRKLKEWEAEYFILLGLRSHIPTCREVGVKITLSDINQAAPTTPL